jgi:hypothetical protein
MTSQACIPWVVESKVLLTIPCTDSISFWLYITLAGTVL